MFSNRAKSTTTLAVITNEPQTITEKPEESFDIAPLFSMSDAYVKMVEKLFLTMIHRVLSEGTIVENELYQKTRNNNCYAAVAGKQPECTQKLICVGIFGQENTNYSFWEWFACSDWVNSADCKMLNISFGIHKAGHISGDTCIDVNIGGLYLSNRTGWDGKFLLRLVRIGSLLILSKLRDFDEWAYQQAGAPGLHWEGEFKSLSTEERRHEITTEAKIFVRRPANADWMLPYIDSPYNKEHSHNYSHQYYGVKVSPNGVALTAYHNMW